MSFRKPCGDRVLDNVEESVFKIMANARNMIKGFWLPKCSLPAEEFIHAMAGSSFDSIHNLR
jgi:hypothetical protein